MAKTKNKVRPYSKEQLERIINSIQKEPRDNFFISYKNPNFDYSQNSRVYKKMTGYASVDKPWLRYYSKEQLENIEAGIEEALNSTVYEYVIESLDDEAIVIDYYGNKITGKTYKEKIEQAAKAFLELGVKEGDMVSLALPNIPEYSICLFALNRIGAISNMVNCVLEGDKLVEQINNAKSNVIIATDIFIKNLTDVIDRTPLEKVVVASISNSLPPIKKGIYQSKNKPKIPKEYILWKEFLQIGQTRKLPEIKFVKNTGVSILYTSGTTGPSKGVVLTNESYNLKPLLYNNIGLDFEPGDRIYHHIPTFLGYNALMATTLALKLKMTMVMKADYNPERFAEDLAKENINHAIGAPADYKSIRELPSKGSRQSKKITKVYPKLKTLGSGSSSIEPEYKKEIHEKLEEYGCQTIVFEGYGSTEGGEPLSTDNPELRIGGIGIPLPLKTVGIFDLDEKTRELTYGNWGEICATGPDIMKEYLNNPEATAEKLILHEDRKIWLHTGDYGFLGKDGVVRYGGRIDKIFTDHNGTRIMPSGIESLIKLNDHVYSCEVVGVTDPNSKSGQIPVANVVLKLNGEKSEDEILDQIETECNFWLEESYIPIIRVIPELPRTPVKKVDYNKLKHDCEAEIKKLLQQKKLVLTPPVEPPKK